MVHTLIVELILGDYILVTGEGKILPLVGGVLFDCCNLCIIIISLDYCNTLYYIVCVINEQLTTGDDNDKNNPQIWTESNLTTKWRLWR